MNLTFTADEIKFLQLRYGCYLKVLDLTKDLSKGPLLKKNKFTTYMAIAFAVFGIINVLVNVMLIYSLFKTNQKMNCGQKLFVYLSCTDLLAGLFVPVVIYFQLVGLNCFYMTIMMGVISYIAIADFSILLIISALRLYGIRFPLSIRDQEKSTFVVVILKIIILFGIVTFFFIKFNRADKVQDFVNLVHVANALLTGLSLAVLGTVSASLHTLRQYRQSNSQVFTPSMLRNHTRSANSLLFIGLLMVFFVSIQIPTFILIQVRLKEGSLLTGETFQTTKEAVDILMLVSQLNTFTNSIIIIARSKKLRQHLFKCFWKKISQTTTGKTTTTKSKFR